MDNLSIKMHQVNMDMFFEANRLKSFTNWKYPSGSKNVCTPEKMAEAGFYAVNDPEYRDLAKCFVCMKELDGWDPDDDPFEEHKKHASYCPFVKFGKKEKDLKIFDLQFLQKEIFIKHLELWYEEQEKMLRMWQAEMKKRVTTLYSSKKK